ncbi:disease resistance protein RPP2B-like [Rosa rugosa]|uniref:disease resistance protein RPP2B-like n=1 Tax=Rosa rugosa TaxID=74645 RepID=UPI002B41380D|nr:disease resistance protein RPP2B-like [Rosa rugosa]
MCLIHPIDVYKEGLISFGELDFSTGGIGKMKRMEDELGLVTCLEKLDASGSGIREVPSSVGLLKNLKELSLAGCKGQSPKSWNMMLNPFQLLRKRSHTPAGLSLASLFGLHSLTKLDLSDCNLSEIPSDFGCLSLLIDLDLSKNQFVRLRESIGQLSRLELLHLDSCCKLQSLPELPTRSWVNISNCISFDTLTNQIEKLMSVNCFKMVENESCKSSALSLLTRYLKFQRWGSSKPHLFSFTASGNEIPEWYNHQSVGSSITVELHPGLFSNKWKGFAWCVVFRLLKPLSPLAEFGLYCSLKANGESLRHCGLSTECLRGAIDGEILQVKKCGVRLIYEEDAEELGQTLLKQSNTKRGLQHYDDDDAASSGTATGASQEEEEEPHPKRFKLLELDGAGPSDQKHD